MRIPILTAILLVIFSIGADYCIFSDIRRYCHKSSKRLWSILYGVSSVSLWVFVTVVLCLPRRSEDSSILPVMWMLFAYLSVYIPKIIYIICSAIGRLVCAIRKKGKNRGIIIGSLLALSFFGIMWWGVLSTRYDIEINNIELTSDKLPKSFDGMKIVQFSDIHVGTWGNDTTFISSLVDSINAQNADVILFTGDAVNRKSSEFDPFKKVLSRLHAPFGVYAILGNHDYGGYVTWKNPGDANKDCARLVEQMGGAGWRVLANKTAFLNNGKDSIVLIGVENWGEPPFNQLGDLGKSYPDSPDHLHGLNDGMYKILMTHNPEHWSQVATQISNIDLSLAGHTHAMQMMAKSGDWKWSPSQYRYALWAGLYSEKAKDGNPMHLYVNIGAGEVGFPARLGAARPEITKITLRSSR